MANPLSSIKGDVKWNDTQVPHASGWKVNPKAKNVEFGPTNLTKGKVGRAPGPLDVSGTFKILSTDGATTVLPGMVGKLQLYPDSGGQPWLIENAIIDDIDGPEVDMETGKVLGYTVKWSFAGKDDGTFGHITLPDGTEYDIDNVLGG